VASSVENRKMRLLIVLTTAWAISLSLAGAIWAKSHYLSSEIGPLNKSVRREVAANLLRDFEKVNNAVPTLSPRERIWVEEELAVIRKMLKEDIARRKKRGLA